MHYIATPHAFIFIKHEFYTVGTHIGIKRCTSPCTSPLALRRYMYVVPRILQYLHEYLCFPVSIHGVDTRRVVGLVLWTEFQARGASSAIGCCFLARHAPLAIIAPRIGSEQHIRIGRSRAGERTLISPLHRPRATRIVAAPELSVNGRRNFPRIDIGT